MARLNGKVAIVTGGARGLGMTCAEALASEGATVVITDVLDDVGEATAEAMRAKGWNVRYAPLDVRDEAGWEKLVDDVVRRHGKLDCLVNNAGVAHQVTIEDVKIDDMRRVYEINLFAQVIGMRTAIAAIKKTGGGSIINMSSNSSSKIIAGHTVYGSSKAALAYITKSSVLQCTQYGIRINSVHPGAMATDMMKAAMNDPAVVALVNDIPMKRMGEPNELKGVITLLASDESSYINGAEIVVDGGATVV